MIPLSRSLVEKARGCDIDFLRCSFRLFPFKPHDGEMPSPKIGSLPGFFERSIRSEPSSAPTRIQIDLQLSVSCSLCRIAQQRTFLRRNAARAKGRKGVAEIFCRSGGAGDDVVNCKRSVRKQKSKGLLTLLSPARGTGKKIGASIPSEPKRRIEADTVGQCLDNGVP